ncbi:hypothetical protein [Microbacterium invictum]|uniref:DUF3137 domain-containing protein n=1 Tax=Microbacterium invictum TaxID=515415 RepID=A0AA40SQM3_9MICO|nr:hypothetical protein [Microbacterium invictum]MBB4140635.1 hypothetical protein [Microbacterium invictum]
MTTPEPPPAAYPFDARPLTEPVDKAAARAYAQQLKNEGRVTSTANWGGIVAIVIVFVVGFGMLSSFFSIAVTMVSSQGFGPGLGFSAMPLLFVLIVVAVIVTTVVRRFGGSRHERWYRLDRFARANGMQWHARSPAPPLPGMVFDLGRDRTATDIVRGDRPRFVEFGNYRYTTGSGKNETTHHWGYIAVKLSSPLPHIVLDAMGNNGLFGSNLPASFDKDQRLSLEGDFDKYFALYCPRGYEADALYLFTPDIMARFIDNAAALDVEIVDDWLFLYAKREFSTLDPQVWAWLFSVVGALLDKFAQWERWRDDRLTAPAAVHAAGTPAAVPATSPAGTPASIPFAAPTTALRPPPGVAAPGRRLARGIPWKTFLVMGIVIVVFVLMQLRVVFG